MTEILDAKQLADRLQIHPDQVRKMTAERTIPHLACGPRLTRYNLDDVIASLRVTQHPDDDAIDAFAAELRKRMTEKRDEGRNGWEMADPADLQLKLLRAIADGDPIDVGNYAMMISTLGGGTEHTLEQHVGQVFYERRVPLVLITELQALRFSTVAQVARDVINDWQSDDAALKPALERLAKALAV